jgi:DNA-binding NtrC family response regulator
MKILLVEDDSDTREILSEMLQMHGHAIVTAGEAQQALAAMRQQTDIELLITDISLPGMSGIELACAANTAHPAIAILICSGYGEQQFAALPFAVTWIQKPLEMDVFLQTVERFSGVNL